MGYIGPSQYIGSSGATKQDVELFVRENGSDTVGNGSSSDPFRNPQAAINKVSKMYGHDVLIDVGEGTFNGCGLFGFNQRDNGVNDGIFTMEGKLGTPTLSQGATSGTAEGDSSTSLTDNEQNWADDELIGMMIKVGSDYRYIIDNSNKNAIVGSEFPYSLTGKDYEIVENKTILNTSQSGLLFGIAVVIISSNVVGYGRRFNMVNLDLQAPSGVGAALYGYGSSGLVLQRIKASGGGSNSTAIQIQNNFGEYTIEDAYINADNFGFSGINLLWNSGPCRGIRAAIDNSDNYGLAVQRSKSVQEIDISILNCANEGVFAFNGEEIFINRAYLQNNAKNGIFIKVMQNVELKKVSGTNGTHGLWVENNTYVDLKDFANLTVTGSSGDFTMNYGTTVHSWSEKFPEDESFIVNEDTLTNIRRNDSGGPA